MESLWLWTEPLNTRTMCVWMEFNYFTFLLHHNYCNLISCFSIKITLPWGKLCLCDKNRHLVVIPGTVLISVHFIEVLTIVLISLFSVQFAIKTNLHCIILTMVNVVIMLSLGLLLYCVYNSLVCTVHMCVDRIAVDEMQTNYWHWTNTEHIIWKIHTRSTMLRFKYAWLRIDLHVLYRTCARITSSKCAQCKQSSELRKWCKKTITNHMEFKF